MVNKKRKTKRKVLEGHKKKGSKFIPPLLQLDSMQEVSYLNDGLPNLIWMGLIFDQYGFRKGVDIIERFVSIAFRNAGGTQGNFSFLCFYSKLDITIKAKIYRELKSEEILFPLQESVAPLSCLFRHFPALFLKPDFKVDEAILVPRLKRVMDSCIDRYSQMSTAIQVTAIYNLMANGKFHVARHIPIPNFDSIFTDPDSDDAARAASFARSNINGELGIRSQEISKGWVRDFWRQIFKLESCELLGEK